MVEMKTIADSDVYIGLSDIKLSDSPIDFGKGVVLSKTYAHLMAPFLMAFKLAPPGGYHPAPWSATSGGFSFDVTAQLSIPLDIESDYTLRMEIAKIIVLLLRLWVDPAIRMAVVSSCPFGEITNINSRDIQITPFEVRPRYFSLKVENSTVNTCACEWVKDNWQIAYKLFSTDHSFRLAAEALNNGQFIQNDSLILVLLWGALEALFSPSQHEITFRVSSLISSYLNNPGEERLAQQKEITKLYDRRSAAAHGKPKHEVNDVLKTFELLRKVVISIVNDKKVPTKDELEMRLFGQTAD